MVRVGEDKQGMKKIIQVTMRIIYHKVSEIIDTVRIMGNCDMIDKVNNALSQASKEFYQVDWDL